MKRQIVIGQRQSVLGEAGHRFFNHPVYLVNPVEIPSDRIHQCKEKPLPAIHMPGKLSGPVNTALFAGLVTLPRAAQRLKFSRRIRAAGQNRRLLLCHAKDSATRIGTNPKSGFQFFGNDHNLRAVKPPHPAFWRKRSSNLNNQLKIFWRTSRRPCAGMI
jgi:hypothetical protein